MLIELVLPLSLAGAVALFAGWLSLRLTRGFPDQGEQGWHGLLPWGDQGNGRPAAVRVPHGEPVERPPAPRDARDRAA